jgi:type VI secretion system protein ImpM
MAFFSRKGKERAADFSQDLIGCFGKLPLQAEFIRLQLALPELQNFDQLLQQSFAQVYKREQELAKQQFAAMPTYYFAHHLGLSEHPLVGLCLPSIDQSGRRYPFVITRVIHNLLAIEQPSITPLLYKNFFWAAQLLAENAFDYTRSIELQTKLKQLKPEQDPAQGMTHQLALHALSEMSFQQFWQGMNIDYPVTPVSCFVEATLDGFAWARERAGRGQKWTLVLPLPTDLEPSVSVSFWLQLTESLLTKTKLYSYWNKPKGSYNSLLLLSNTHSAESLLSYLIEPTQNCQALFNIVTAARLLPKIENSTAILLEAMDENLLQTVDRWRQLWP